MKRGSRINKKVLSGGQSEKTWMATMHWDRKEGMGWQK